MPPPTPRGRGGRVARERARGLHGAVGDRRVCRRCETRGNGRGQGGWFSAGAASGALTQKVKSEAVLLELPYCHVHSTRDNCKKMKRTCTYRYRYSPSRAGRRTNSPLREPAAGARGRLGAGCLRPRYLGARAPAVWSTMSWRLATSARAQGQPLTRTVDRSNLHESRSDEPQNSSSCWRSAAEQFPGRAYRPAPRQPAAERPRRCEEPAVAAPQCAPGGPRAAPAQRRGAEAARRAARGCPCLLRGACAPRPAASTIRAGS